MHDKTILRAFLALSVCVQIVASAGCRPPAIDRDHTHRSAATYLPASAEEIRYGKAGPIEELSYVARVEYPATNFLSTVALQLQDQGWTAAKTFHDDDDNKTSNFSGWSEFTDRTERLPRRIRTWEGEWRNAEGEAISYMLRYWENDDSLLRVWIQREPVD